MELEWTARTTRNQQVCMQSKHPGRCVPGGRRTCRGSLIRRREAFYQALGALGDATLPFPVAWAVQRVLVTVPDGTRDQVQLQQEI